MVNEDIFKFKCCSQEYLCSLKSPFLLNGVVIIIFSKKYCWRKASFKSNSTLALLVNIVMVWFPYVFSFQILKLFSFKSLIRQHLTSIFHLFIVRLKIGYLVLKLFSKASNTLHVINRRNGMAH